MALLNLDAATLHNGFWDNVDGAGTHVSQLLANIGAAVDADTTGLAGLGTASIHAATDFDAAGAATTAQNASLQKTSNLSDLNNALTARSNLGLGNSSTLNVGTTTGTVAAGNDSRITGAAQTASNLSDLANAATSRTNLGLGGSAVLNVGSTTGTVAAGDDGRITGSAQKASNLSDLASASSARTNLGLGGAALLAVGTTTGTVAAGDDSRITGAAQKASNLSDVANAATAATNLGLGSASGVRHGTLGLGGALATARVMELFDASNLVPTATGGAFTLNDNRTYTAANQTATISDNPLTSGATTAHLNAVGTLPGTNAYYVQVDSEIMLVTAGAGTTTLTITRAQLGTSAASHAQNATLTWLPRAGDGDATGSLRINPEVTLTGGQADYDAVSVGGQVTGTGTVASAVAYACHFDLLNTGGATLHAGYQAHLGIIQSGGVVTDQACFHVSAMNSLFGTATISNNPLTSGGTSITLNSAGTLPSSGNYYATLDHEIVLVTAGQGTTTLTVTRAQGGTTAVPHVQNTQIGAVAVANATGYVMDDTASFGSAAQYWGFRVGNFPSQHRGALGLGGATTKTLPAAQLDVRQGTAQGDVLRLASIAGNGGSDDILVRTVQNQLNTTDASAHQLIGVTLTANKTHRIILELTWHRTGGSSGTANDGGTMAAAYALKYDGTTVTQIGSTATVYSMQTPGGIAVPAIGALAYGIQGFNITGIATTNITWHCNAYIQVVGS